MSPPLWALSVPIGSILVFVPRVTSLVLQIKSGAPLQNSNPREHVASKEVAAKDTHGYVRRAFAAHQNSLESMFLWSAALMLANARGVSADRMNASAGVWLVARVVYIPAYILIKSNTKAIFRTGVFAVGLSSTLSLMWHAALMD
eukprot:g9737.t1